MKIFIVKKFQSNGWNDWHDDKGTFSTLEKAEQCFKEQGLKIDPKDKKHWYSDYIEEREIA